MQRKVLVREGRGKNVRKLATTWCIRGGIFCLLAIVSSCQAVPLKNTNLNEVAKVESSAALCETELAAIWTNFPAARANHCEITAPNKLVLTISPENQPINKSAWYGFKIVPKRASIKHGSILYVNLKYAYGHHRYSPKISYDGKNWVLLDPAKIEILSKTNVRLSIPLDDRPVMIAAQEIFSNSAHNQWAENLASTTKSNIGKSVEGRPIYKLETRSGSAKKPYVFIVGRQHPPETTGALALMPFVETLLGDTVLAHRFRDKYGVIIVPNINPDGVWHGHWRHNINGIDLNRDWGPFTQPETKAIENELKRFKEGGDKIVLFLDFHSTYRNLFYTQTDGEPTRPANFSRDWLGAANARLGDNIYAFTREQSPNSGKPTSKNYMYSRYKIPAITYEVGDKTDRDAIALAAEIFASEMMKKLIEWNPSHE
ncbi:MAG: hypothetical protein COA43_08200 [Robiginitomaculum sp.]|nr:MAG: hypothetical protein COA43_08200 [Robiginitomaculum sp.]